MNQTEIEAIAADLVDDGDKVELENGAIVQLKTPWDEFLNYFDASDPEVDGVLTLIGRYEDVPEDALTIRDYVWTPPADLVGLPVETETLRQYISDRLEFGYVTLVVEVVGPDVDAYKRPIVHGVAMFGGVDEPYPEAVLDLVAEALAEAYPLGYPRDGLTT